MKISLFGITDIPLGKHNVRDPRLDVVDKLVEAKKKTYVQVDVVSDAEASTADAIVVTESSRLETILMDLDVVETRLSRSPPEPELTALNKIKTCLEAERFASSANLTAEESQAVASQTLLTLKPVVVAIAEDLGKFDEFLPRVLAESGYISYLTVGGPENRAWLIKKGMTAPEAAGAIHTDIQKGFIRAEVISFADVVAAGGEKEAKHANKLRLETKQYVVQDYDLVNFRFTK
jgi:ribosome-binding ATPase YchF (GTP1/OBG family)